MSKSLHPVSQEKKIRESSTTFYKGLLFTMLSGIFYSSCAVIVKKMNNLHPGQLSLYRFITFFVMSMPQTVKCDENPLGPKDRRMLLLLRGVLGATTLFLTFMTYRLLPLGEGTTILFSFPVFVTLTAKVFLKEPCGAFQSIAVVLTVIGVIFMSKLPSHLSEMSVVFTSDRTYGVLAAIAAVLFRTGQFVIIRKLKNIHHAIIMFNFGWVAIIETVILTCICGYFKWNTCGIQRVYIILFILFSYVGQTLLVKALQCEFAGPVATMKSAVDIALAFLWQVFLFQNIPDVYSTTGAFLVGFSVVFVGLNKWVSSLPKDSSISKKIRWITL